MCESNLKEVVAIESNMVLEWSEILTAVVGGLPEVSVTWDANGTYVGIDDDAGERVKVGNNTPQYTKAADVHERAIWLLMREYPNSIDAMAAQQALTAMEKVAKNARFIIATIAVVRQLLLDNMGKLSVKEAAERTCVRKAREALAAIGVEGITMKEYDIVIPTNC